MISEEKQILKASKEYSYITIEEPIQPWGYMIRNVLSISIPVMLTNVSTIVVEVINLAYVGHMGDQAKVAGVGLGNMYINMVCLAVL